MISRRNSRGNTPSLDTAADGCLLSTYTSDSSNCGSWISWEGAVLQSVGVRNLKQRVVYDSKLKVKGKYKQLDGQ